MHTNLSFRVYTFVLLLLRYSSTSRLPRCFILPIFDLVTNKLFRPDWTLCIICPRVIYVCGQHRSKSSYCVRYGCMCKLGVAPCRGRIDRVSRSRYTEWNDPDWLISTQIRSSSRLVNVKIAGYFLDCASLKADNSLPERNIPAVIPLLRSG